MKSTNMIISNTIHFPFINNLYRKKERKKDEFSNLLIFQIYSKEVIIIE